MTITEGSAVLFLTGAHQMLLENSQLAIALSQLFLKDSSYLYKVLHPTASTCLSDKVSLNQLLLLNIFYRISDENHLKEERVI